MCMTEVEDPSSKDDPFVGFWSKDRNKSDSLLTTFAAKGDVQAVTTTRGDTYPNGSSQVSVLDRGRTGVAGKSGLFIWGSSVRPAALLGGAVGGLGIKRNVPSGCFLVLKHEVFPAIRDCSFLCVIHRPGQRSIRTNVP